MSYNKSLFEGVPKKNVNKSKFNLSHEYKTQIQPGLLVPILTMETMPQDYWEIETEFYFRFAPLYFPIMQKFTMRADYFYIPNRILWNEGTGANVGWKRWITEQDEVTPPQMNAEMRYLTGGWNNNVLNFMGLPMVPQLTNTKIKFVSAYPLSAYLKIWDEYYRNPQLEDERWFNLSSGDNTTAFETAFSPWVETASPILMCLPSKYEKDYFTSAIPTPQLGEAILIPSLGIEEDGDYTPQKVYNEDGTTATGIALGADGGELIEYGTANKVVVETQATIRQLRLAETLQGFYERIMKVGTRYRDWIQGFFEGDPTPMAVDVPVLIGSEFGRVQVSDVLTQSYTEVSSTKRSTGDYVGQMNMYQNGSKLTYKCLEHGWIMCIMQLNPNTSYGQGIERFWRRDIQTDYPMDIFAGIGDQEILKEEVFYTGVPAHQAKNQDTFGYIPRFSEMRYKNSMFTGQLAHKDGVSQHAGRLWDYSYYSINMDSLNLGEEFISARTVGAPAEIGDIRLSDIWRILPGPTSAGDPAEGVVYCHIYHSIWVDRALPMYSTPQL